MTTLDRLRNLPFLDDLSHVRCQSAIVMRELFIEASWGPSVAER